MSPISGTPRVLHVAQTIAILLFAFLLFLTNYNREKHRRGIVVQRKPFQVLAASLICGSYIAETAFIYLQSFNFEQIQDILPATALSALAWATASLRKQTGVTEIFGLSLISTCFGGPLLALHALTTTDIAATNTAWLVNESARLFLLAALLISCAWRLRPPRDSPKHEEEAIPILNGGGSDAAVVASSYGSTEHGDAVREYDENETDDEDDADGPESGTGLLRKNGSWIVYLSSFRVFLPYLFPKGDLRVQACLLTCVLCLIGNRVLNVMVPLQIGLIADKLYAGEPVYSSLTLFFFLYLLHGDLGVQLLLNLAKIPIKQFSYRQLTNAAFRHVMGLTMEFHSDRDSAEVMKSIEQGEALTNVLITATLEMMPTVIDMFVAFFFLYLKFNSTIALCMFAASLAFIAIEMVATGWNIENRRSVTKAEREQARVMHQAVQGWQTVWAFNMFSYEEFRFGSAVNRQLLAKETWLRRDAYISAMTDVMVPITFCLLASLIVHEIYLGHATAGDFAFMAQYWNYLVWPIKYLTHEYRDLMSDLVDAERLLDLLTTKSTITNRDGALSLDRIEGHLTFEDVSFSYDSQRTVVRGVNISASAGETIALVGATGSGKSSLIKLLMRHYDVTSGAVKIDGHDVRDMTLDSLRNALGVVPQDPLLFNASIIENLRYAKLDSSDDDIYTACRAAAIHDKILSFPEGYDTKVGEQGIKLSGGEVQRLAIARAFLKDPPILILDEATSAVDTETESEIQEALRRLSRKRTTLVIAHRLSTVVGADQILVMHDGTVVERGTHEELLEKGQRYRNLWQKQFSVVQEGELLVKI